MYMEELDFNVLLQEKRHKEIIKILTDILKETSNIDITVPKIDPITMDLSSIEKLISSINHPDYSDIPKSIKLIGAEIIKKIDVIKKEPTRRVTKRRTTKSTMAGNSLIIHSVKLFANVAQKSRLKILSIIFI